MWDTNALALELFAESGLAGADETFTLVDGELVQKLRKFDPILALLNIADGRQQALTLNSNRLWQRLFPVLQASSELFTIPEIFVFFSSFSKVFAFAMIVVFDWKAAIDCYGVRLALHPLGHVRIDLFNELVGALTS